MRCQKEADATQATIQLANRLVGGLASEKVRWAEAVAEYDMKCHCHLAQEILITAFYSDLCNKEPHCLATHFW